MFGILTRPVCDSPDTITWTVWSTLSEADFERCSKLWHTAGRESEPPYVGSLSNPIPSYATSANLKVLVHTQPLGVRPKIEVVEESHPLWRDQKHGISAARADDLIHAAL